MSNRKQHEEHTPVDEVYAVDDDGRVHVKTRGNGHAGPSTTTADGGWAEETKTHLETKWDFLAYIAKQFGFNALLVVVMIAVCVFLYRENEKTRDAFLNALALNTTALGEVAKQQSATSEAVRQTNGRLDKLTDLMASHLDHDDYGHRPH